MAAAFVGSWKLTESEKFDDFLKELGVNMVLRKFAQAATPTVNISNEGDKWKIETITTMKTSLIEFKMGEEFLEKRLDGNEVRSVMTMDGNKMIQKQFADEAKKLKEVTITRWIDGNRLLVEAAVSDIVSTRKYDRQ
ncbi:fatty acid-binding protein homolog 5-like isoform X1 [Varroa jacobsoni]|uniref:Fatty acid-binding protein n=2 Tax=Varroa TaxID=62624 RepID=A0A7M7KDR0_VARDE|nr:fatty acid-binding protein homolog 5-like [Varroa destructor]XP_022690958.1 fatty acid-binding protein homolog 5-like isoform X1 [Varroa jacobsoni]